MTIMQNTKSSNFFVWVFVGGKYPRTKTSAVFSSKEIAELWIKTNRVSGTLTAYPLDVGVYDWAVANGFFKPNAVSSLPEKIAIFTSARQEHYHYDEGITGEVNYTDDDDD